MAYNGCSLRHGHSAAAVLIHNRPGLTQTTPLPAISLQPSLIFLFNSADAGCCQQEPHAAAHRLARLKLNQGKGFLGGGGLSRVPG